MIIPERSSNLDFYLKMDIEITPETAVQIDFDPKVGDVIRAHAKGNLKMEYNTDEEFYMYGETEIVDGNYLFTLENVINKKFIIKQGGTITWTGDTMSASLNLDAIYQTRAPLKELVADTLEAHKSANVDCKMHLTGILTQPDIEFSIDIINGSDMAKSQIANMSQDEINKQFVFLLIMNRFYTQTMTPDAARNDNIGATAGSALGSTGLELISNQVSNWLSQISKDFDIGFKYQPGTEMTGQEVELAMSTQILNDRVLINGNVAYGDSKTTNTNSMVGDLEVQYKVTQKGNFRVKGFSRKNNEIETEYGPYTAGVGVFYTQEFNTFKEMITDIWRKVTLQALRERKRKKK
jgi:hypothetical protein